MHAFRTKDISNFYIAGISYKKSDAAIRGKFAINDEQYSGIIALSPSFGLNEFFVLSTCNRTEIYGFASEPTQLIDLLCSQTEGSAQTFKELAYIKSGPEAIEHLFNVSAGLDSQLLGDYEIVGQIKLAAKFAKRQGFMGSFTERLVNCILQSSKAIKNQTSLSGGTVSLSFAAIQYIKEKIAEFSEKRILLLGTGKIGRNTCKNLVDYLGTKNITLINRTEEKAAKLANELGLTYAPLEELPIYIAQSNIIVVATNATEPVILRSHLEGSDKKIIIDLSIPCNVEQTAQKLSNIVLVNVDELSKLKDETIAKRIMEIPKARAIIAEHIEEFMNWYEMRKHVPVLKAVKIKLKEIHTSPLFIEFTPTTHALNYDTDEKIQRVINSMAHKMRQYNQRGCHYIEAINEFITSGTN